MHLATLAYALGLTIILAFGVRSPQLGASRAIIAVFILLWADLILTTHLLSLGLLPQRAPVSRGTRGYALNVPLQ